MRGASLMATLLACGCFSEGAGGSGDDADDTAGETAGTTGATSTATSTSDATTVDTGSEAGTSGEASAATSVGDASSTGGALGCSPGATHRMTLGVPDPGEAMEHLVLLVRLTPERFDYDLAASGGSDVRLYTPGCDPLPFEIERWVHGETSDVWVGLPMIQGPAELWLEIGDPEAAALPTDLVWAAYAGVWHLQGDPDGAVPQFPDATGKPELHASTFGSGTGVLSAMGAFGGAVRFAAGEIVFVPDSMWLDPGAQLTLEAWVNPASIDALSDRWAVRRLNLASAGAAYGFLLTNDDVPSNAPSLSVELQDTFVTPAASAAPVPVGSWHYLAGTYDAGTGTLRLYVDGELVDEQVAAATGSPIAESGSTLFVGQQYDGLVDELRLSHLRLSAPRIGLQFQSMSDTLLDYGRLAPI